MNQYSKISLIFAVTLLFTAQGSAEFLSLSKNGAGGGSEQSLADVLSVGKVTNATEIDMDGADLIDSGTTIWDTSNGYVPSSSIQASTLSSVLSRNNDGGGTIISNIGTPSDSSDAATKGYVDTNDDTISDDQNLDQVLTQGNDMNGQEIVDTAGSITLGGGNVNIPDGQLSLTGSSADDLSIAPASGQTPTVSMSHPDGGTIEIEYQKNLYDETHYIAIANSKGENDTGKGITVGYDDSDVIPQQTTGNLGLSSQRWNNVYSSGLDTTGALDMNGNKILSNDGEIDFSGSFNRFISKNGVNYLFERDDGVDLLTVKTGGNVAIPNGNLNMNGNLINNVGQIQDNSGNTMVNFDHSNRDVEINDNTGFQIPVGADAY